MGYDEIIECLEDGVKLEYLFVDSLGVGFWFTLFKDSPIRLIIENEIRRKI